MSACHSPEPARVSQAANTLTTHKPGPRCSQLSAALASSPGSDWKLVGTDSSASHLSQMLPHAQSPLVHRLCLHCRCWEQAHFNDEGAGCRLCTGLRSRGFWDSSPGPGLALANQQCMLCLQLWHVLVKCLCPQHSSGWSHILSCPPGPAPAEPWSPAQDRRVSCQCPLFKCTVILIFDVLKGRPVRPCALEHLKGWVGLSSVFLLKSTHSLDGPGQVTQLLYSSESCLKTQTDMTVSQVQDENITGTSCPLWATPPPS